MNKDGQLSYEEFLRALCRVMPESYTLDQLRKLTSYVDVDHDGFIQFEEFEKSFTLMDKSSSDQNYMHSQKLVSYIWKNKAPLRTVYRLLDPGNGRVSIENLKTGEDAVCSAACCSANWLAHLTLLLCCFAALPTGLCAVTALLLCCTTDCRFATLLRY